LTQTKLKVVEFLLDYGKGEAITLLEGQGSPDDIVREVLCAGDRDRAQAILGHHDLHDAGRHILGRRGDVEKGLARLDIPGPYQAPDFIKVRQQERAANKGGNSGPEVDGIKILDFSDNGFVPSGAAALGDMGADVIKLERTIGDPMRRIIAQGLVPSVGGFDFMFELVNRNKRGIALDVETPEGREVFEKLVAWADVYITNQLPRVRDKLKTQPEDLFAINPKLVFARGHGQGQRGPDAGAGGYDGVSYWARGSVAHVLTPEGSDGPIGARPAFGDIPSGFNLAGGVCAGLVHVLRTGEGVVVDTALLNTAVWQLGPDLTYASMAGTEMPRGTGGRTIQPLMGTYLTKDGRYCSLMMIVEDNYWAQGMRALDLAEYIDSHTTPEDRSRDADLIREKARLFSQQSVSGFPFV
jgi:crotonobetainyl-CoA:carnitine CoA-transferase CaiB-like acyl-CoA transferase